MDYRIIYLCSLLVAHTLYAPLLPSAHQQYITVDSKGQPVTVNVTISPEIDIKPNNLFQPGNTINTINQGGAAIAQSKSNATNTVMNKIKLFMAQSIQKIRAISPQNIGHSAANWGKIHTKKIMLYTAAISYTLLALMLMHGNLFIRKGTIWAAWKKQLSMEELFEIPHEQLGKELLQSIQQRHINVQNPTDHITPLVRFVHAVDQEMKLLNRYIRIATRIRRCHLMRLFPTNNQKIKKAQELKERLGFVKHTFISWTATDNLANFHH